MYHNKLDSIVASQKQWRFKRGDSSVIADCVMLRHGGIIEGHYHPNEVAWSIVDDAVVFLDSEGKISTAFNHMTFREDGDRIFDVTLQGFFRDTAGHHILQERAGKEIADHDPAAVDRCIEIIQSLPAHLMRDVGHLEHVLIPSLGLNNEMLNEQPPELSPYFGKGLFLWQYPNQFAGYLAWLAAHATQIEHFAEIGCRWGGTFIVVCEWLKRVSPGFKGALAIDPIVPSPFMKRYLEVSRGGSHAISYLQGFSTGEECKQAFARLSPDMVFVDGDHDLPAALADHLLARKTARIIVHHDIVSDACPQTTLLWRAVREMEAGYVAESFVDQYESVRGSFLGIGCLRLSEK